jgi:two-component system cell cycle response regulator
MSTTAPRILLVEDDLGLANAYKARMEAENFHVKHCPNGEAALQAALEYHPDLILLDIMMPKISGFDVLDILRNTPEIAHTKIIILTALSQPADRQRAKDLGADEFLVKSQAVIADVMKRIRFHLGVKEAPQNTTQ